MYCKDLYNSGEAQATPPVTPSVERLTYYGRRAAVSSFTRLLAPIPSMVNVDKPVRQLPALTRGERRRPSRPCRPFCVGHGNIGHVCVSTLLRMVYKYALR